MRHAPLSHRGLLPAAAPLSVFGPRVFAGKRVVIADSAMAPPICKTASPVPVTVVAGRRALKLTWNATATHGGCMRLLAARDSGITSLEHLKGKTIGNADLGAPDKTSFQFDWQNPTLTRRPT